MRFKTLNSGHIGGVFITVAAQMSKMLECLVFTIEILWKWSRPASAMWNRNRLLDQMYFGDHVPPHFQALYAEFEDLIDFQTFEVIRGDLLSRATALALERAQQHREELRRDWDLCAQNQTPAKILPLP